MQGYCDLPFALDSDGRVPTANRGSPWFDDGNIILFAGNIAFKVYKGLVARYSELFANLFVVIPPQRLVGFFVEQCLAVRVDDSPVQLSTVLDFIHAGVAWPQLDFDDFDILGPILQTTTQYQLTQLRDALLRPLVTRYADRLRAYFTWDAQSAFPAPMNPVHMLNFARQAPMPALVPVTLLELSLFVSEADLLAAREPRRRSAYAPGVLFQRDEDICAPLRAHHRTLASGLASVLWRFVELRAPGPTRHACSFGGFHAEIVAALAQGGSLAETDARFGLAMMHAIRTHAGRGAFCAECLAELDVKVMQEYQKWFLGIPPLFGLAGWQDLQAALNLLSEQRPSLTASQA